MVPLTGTDVPKVWEMSVLHGKERMEEEKRIRCERDVLIRREREREDIDVVLDW